VLKDTQPHGHGFREKAKEVDIMAGVPELRFSRHQDLLHHRNREGDYLPNLRLQVRPT
jgi:hypothetical protein